MCCFKLPDAYGGRCPHKGVKATNVVSSGASIGIYSLLSSWMVDQTTLERVSLRLLAMNKINTEKLRHLKTRVLVATSRQLEGEKVQKKVEVQKLMEENVNNAKSWL
ncbi:BnaC09g11210D [Brassica napus]|uniref:BnaC09g11210D protein n=2 Tax=Brassica TaxID=3705 RepID=A0A078GJF1_BRANA|nr:BnaC09g11210D [Brassica napus]VDD29219.1 unnamed protein product [Brassica oleracea]